MKLRRAEKKTPDIKETGICDVLAFILKIVEDVPSAELSINQLII